MVRSRSEDAIYIPLPCAVMGTDERLWKDVKMSINKGNSPQTLLVMQDSS